MTNKRRPEGWEKIKIAAHNRLLREKGSPLFDDDYLEAGADAMLEALDIHQEPIDIELDWRRATTTSADFNIPGKVYYNKAEVQPESYCKFPSCSSKVIAAHGYCQEHYERLNKVT